MILKLICNKYQEGRAAIYKRIRNAAHCTALAD